MKETDCVFGYRCANNTKCCIYCGDFGKKRRTPDTCVKGNFLCKTVLRGQTREECIIEKLADSLGRDEPLMERSDGV